MNYEVVELKEKKIVGVNAETSNADPKMGEIIGGLWTDLYQGGVIAKIKNKSSQFAIGLYSDYTENGYQVTAGCEVSEAANPELTTKVIPAGKYAKFEIHGDMKQAVGEAWGEIWQMNLDRTYTGDFEEYVDDCMENATIYIYIAIRG